MSMKIQEIMVGMINKIWDNRDVRTVRETDGRTDKHRRTYGQTDRQADKHTDKRLVVDG